MDHGHKRMKIAESSIYRVIERFPEDRPSLERLWEINASFQSLCGEYEDCSAALKYWQQSVAEDARGYRDEYAALLQELEEEIVYYLENIDQGTVVSDQ